MGRWAQAQRRGGWVNPGAGWAAPDESSFAISAAEDTPVEVEAVFAAPQGANWYFWQISAIATPAVIVDDGDDGFPPPPRATSFTAPIADVYQIRFAWGISGTIYTGYGPWLPIEF